VVGWRRGASGRGVSFPGTAQDFSMPATAFLLQIRDSLAQEAASSDTNKPALLAHVENALGLLALHDEVPALQHFVAAARANEDLASAWNNIGVSLLSSKSTNLNVQQQAEAVEKALAPLQRAVKMAPESRLFSANLRCAERRVVFPDADCSVAVALSFE